MNLFKKNHPNWKKTEILEELNNFDEIYKQRPIKNNEGGMKYPTMFAIYFILKKINPEFVIESGIWWGQGTWLIEKTLPTANILSLDINLKKRKYISKKAKYSESDFKYQDFTSIPENSLAIFDDHQNALERMMQAKWFNIKHLIFDDNYPPKQGDCYSIKKAFAKSGLNHQLKIKGIIKTLFLIFLELFKKKTNKNYLISSEILSHRFFRDVKPNNVDFRFIERNIETYYEFPPIFKHSKTKWNDNWNDEEYPTENPLLDNSQKLENQTAFDPSNFYTWPTYVKLL